MSAIVDSTSSITESIANVNLNSEDTIKPKENINIVFTGHVDAGKSTISGQIL